MLGENPEPIPRRNWSELREWGNIGIAAAALLLSIVSFWVTLQVSSIEDYLRSEIGRRNFELNRLSDRASQLEEIAHKRETLLQELDAATVSALTSVSDAQLKISDAETRLREVQFEASKAAASLASARFERGRVADQLNSLSKRFRLLQMREAYELVSLSLFSQSSAAHNTVRKTPEAAVMTGALFVDIVNGVRAPSEKTEVSDFVRKAQAALIASALPIECEPSPCRRVRYQY